MEHKTSKKIRRCQMSEGRNKNDTEDIFKGICSKPWVQWYKWPVWQKVIVLCLMMILQIGCGGEYGKVVAITASSTMFPNDAVYSPRYLMEAKKTIWHSQSPPKYPEWVEIVFCPPAAITHLGIMAQDDSPAGSEHKRGPKSFVLQGSNDRTNWKDLLKV